MAKVSKRTFSLSDEQAAYIDAKVDDGAYASASEVVRAGLRALQERDAAVERWLKDEVIPTYDAMKADPSQESLPRRSSRRYAHATPGARRVVKLSECCVSRLRRDTTGITGSRSVPEPRQRLRLLSHHHCLSRSRLCPGSSPNESAQGELLRPAPNFGTTSFETEPAPRTCPVRKDDAAAHFMVSKKSESRPSRWCKT